MIASADERAEPYGMEKLGTLAEYRSPSELLLAAQQLRKLGYTKLEAYSPFPIHGIDDVLQIKQSVLPWLVLVAGVIGGMSALAFQWWTNTVDYAYIISGKPMFSLPANIPITFEVIILLAAFAAFFGMLVLNGLPRLSNPLLRNDRFRRVTNDGFFLLVEATNESYSAATLTDVRERTQATSVQDIQVEPTSGGIPRWIFLTGAVLATCALLPPVMIAKARTTKSEQPRFHNFFNMDFQPKFKSQTTSPLFADGRAMRPRVEGTLPRGAMVEDERFLYGIESDVSGNDMLPSERDADTPTVETQIPIYVDKIPVPVNEQLMRDGRTQFNIHCAVCHGRAGYGNGLASQRALELEQGTWLPPTSIHAAHVLEQPDGQLFNSITNGVRKMPAYGHQIPPRDRWAIIAYIRALQRSQNANIDDVPEDYRQTLREFN